MTAWSIGSNLVLLTYVAVAFVVRGTPTVLPVVASILLFISAVLGASLARARLPRLLLRLGAVVVSLAACFLVDRDFAVLFPLCAAELVHDITGKLRWTFLPAVLLAPFLGPSYLPAYLLAAGGGLGILGATSTLAGRMRRLERERDDLLSSNDALYRRSALRAASEDEAAALAQLEERNRLAQDIHDRVGHAITGGIIQAEAATAVLDRDPDAARALMQNCASVLREGHESIRAALRGIRPAPEQLGIHRLKRLVDDNAAAGGIPATLSHDGDLGAITYAQWRAIIDSVRECLTNATRHSDGRSVKVRVETLNRVVRAEVKDDGRGCESYRKGLGISGIEERIEGLGGTVVIDGTNGFSVVLLLPRSAEKSHGD